MTNREKRINKKEKAKLMCICPQGTKQISTNYLECNKQARDAWNLHLKATLMKIVLKHSKQK